MAVVDGMNINGNAYDLRDKVAVRFNEAQTLTDAQKAIGRGNIDAVALKQGAANAGKALVVGNDGNVTLGQAGISDDVAQALLDLLRHVAYTDGQGQTYYKALRDALYGGIKWRWSQTDGDFLLRNNTCGFAEGVGRNIYIDTRSDRETVRRSIVVSNGSAAFVLYNSSTGGSAEETQLYPMPVPPTANYATVTSDTDGLLVGMINVSLADGSYTNLIERGAGSTVLPREYWFESGQDRYLLWYMKRSDSGEFVTEPENMVVQFASVDKWTYTLTGGDFTVVSYSSSTQDDASKDHINAPIITNLNTNDKRRTVIYNRGMYGYVMMSNYQYSATQFPIPIPRTANRVRVTVQPAIQIGVAIHKLDNNAWTRPYNGSWASQQDVTFEAGENQVLRVSFRVDASSSSFTSATEPREIVVAFEEV